MRCMGDSYQGGMVLIPTVIACGQFTACIAYIYINKSERAIAIMLHIPYHTNILVIAIYCTAVMGDSH